jgi:hypothetical protein
MRHRRAPSRRRKPHRRPIVADAIKDRIVQPRRQRLHLLPRRLRAIDNSARRNLLLLPQLPRRRHSLLRANGVSSARHNPHKLRRLHKLRHRHRRLRANNGGNGLSVRGKLRRKRLLLRLQRQSRLPLRQRLRQNRPIPITAKNRTATEKTTGPLRPDPIPNWVAECSIAVGLGARQ